MDDVQLIVQLVVEAQVSWWKARVQFCGSWHEVLLHFPPSQSCRYHVNGRNAGLTEVEKRLMKGRRLQVCGNLKIDQVVGNLPMKQADFDELDTAPTEFRLMPTLVNLLLSIEDIAQEEAIDKRINQSGGMKSGGQEKDKEVVAETA